MSAKPHPAAWSSIHLVHAEEIARDPQASIDLRLHMAVMAGKRRSSNEVRFLPGDLAETLSTVDKSTGTLKPRSRKVLNSAIKRGIERGSFREGSNARCILTADHAFPNGHGGS